MCDRRRCCCALLPRTSPVLQAFKCMPPAVRTRLAKACQGLQLPPGALVFEEDDKGDAMYVVVAGCLQVRVVAFQSPKAEGQVVRSALVAQGAAWLQWCAPELMQRRLLLAILC